MSVVLMKISVKIGDEEEAKTTRGTPDKSRVFRHFSMPLFGTTGAIPLKILHDSILLTCHPSDKYRQNRSSFRGDKRENVPADEQVFGYNATVIG